MSIKSSVELIDSKMKDVKDKLKAAILRNGGTIESANDPTFTNLVDAISTIGTPINGQDRITGKLQDTVVKSERLYATDYKVFGPRLDTHLVNGEILSIDFNHNDTLMAVTMSDFPYLEVYRVQTPSFLSKLTIDVLPTGRGKRLKFNSTGTRLFVVHDNAPRLSIYNVGTNSLVKMPNVDVMPVGNPWDVDGNRPVDDMIAVANEGNPSMHVYRLINNVFTKIANPNITPTNTGISVSFSLNNTLVCLGQWAGTRRFVPYSVNRTLWSLTEYTSIDAHIQNNSVPVIRFSNIGWHTAIGFNSEPFFALYRVDTVNGFRLMSPLTEPLPGSVWGISFSNNDEYMSICHSIGSGNSAVTTYRFINDELIKVTSPEGYEVRNGRAMAYSKNGNLLAMGTIGGNQAPSLSVYQHIPGIQLMRSLRLSDAPSMFAICYTTRDANAGETITVNRIFRRT